MPELSNINVVREILGRHGFKFSKSLGQNFIVNPELCPRIAEESGVGPGICALEIGPGIGVLTKELALRAEKVLSIEIDKNLLPVLKETLAEFDNVKILNADVLELDLKAMNSGKYQGNVDVLYSDEDKVTMDLSEHFQPHFKPDFNLDLLRSNNYITHFFVVRTSLVKEIGGFRREYDGAQDYDFIFRCVEKAENICHIPEILYHWRTHKASTADNPASKMYAFEAGKRAIEGNLQRTGTKGIVDHTKDSF